MTPDLEIHPLTGRRWDDAVAMFGTRGDPARCWCQWFRMRNPQWRSATTASNRAGLRGQAETASAGQLPPGVVGYLDGLPVGWCGAGPRPGYPRMLASRLLREDAVAADVEDPDVWSVTCFVVRAGRRNQGLSLGLLEAAVEVAAVWGARVVEGYPIDVDVKSAAGTPISASGLYHGALSTFLKAGFREVARPSPARPVVRLDLSGGGGPSGRG